MQMTSLKSKFIRWIIGNKEKQSSSIGNRQIILLSWTGEIFLNKVAGLQALLKRDSNTGVFL